MEATIVVAPTQYFARVEPSGEYHLPAVPPGEYTVVAWHKAAGFFRKQIVVAAGRSTSADFLIPLPAEPPQNQPDHAMTHGGGH
jgi:hypothetical protein